MCIGGLTSVGKLFSPRRLYDSITKRSCTQMKVAMLTYSTKARGGVAHALKLSEHLRTCGVDVTLYSLARDDEEEAADGYFRPVDVPYEIFPYEWHSDVMVRLDRMIDAYSSNLPLDADAYHAQDCVGGTALAELRREGRLDAPIFRTVHHVDDFAEPRLFEFEKRAVRHADHRFVVSEYWKRELLESYGLDATVAYNGLDPADFSDLPSRRSHVPTVLFVGGLEPRKGLEYLVLAMADIANEIPDVRLEVIAKAGFRGVDSVGWFELLAERAGVLDRIEFRDAVTQDALLQHYSDADVVVLPSRNEGWGLSLMEAMACGRAVVGTTVGGIPELVRDGVDGILVPPGDIGGLAAAVVQLLRDDGLRERMGSSGKERVRSFSWGATAELTAGAYGSALRSPSRTRS